MRTESLQLDLNEHYWLEFGLKPLPCMGPFGLDNNDITFLSSSVNGFIGNYTTHFFLSFLMTKNLDSSVLTSSSVNGP